MRKARKAHGDKVILDDVTLNFLPGAKIGVVGPNGAGKSTVLKIMAGLEQPSNGDAFLSPGYRRRRSWRTSRRASPRSRASSTGSTRSPS
jgi:ATPase subunit of ABC transporter with duplicated ATPase domains